MHSDEEIAQAVGLDNCKSVSRIIGRILQVHEDDEDRFINSEGEQIREGSAQHRLISVSIEGIEPWRLAMLSQLQRQALEAVVSRQPDGRFLSFQGACEKVGFVQGDFLAKIARVLEEDNWILEVDKLMRRALAEKVDLLTDDDKLIIDYILTAISEGRPLRSKTKPTVAWNAVSEEFGLPGHSGWNLWVKVKR